MNTEVPVRRVQEEEGPKLTCYCVQNDTGDREVSAGGVIRRERWCMDEEAATLTSNLCRKVDPR